MELRRSWLEFEKGGTGIREGFRGGRGSWGAPPGSGVFSPDLLRTSAMPISGSFPEILLIFDKFICGMLMPKMQFSLVICAIGLFFSQSDRPSQQKSQNQKILYSPVGGKKTASVCLSPQKESFGQLGRRKERETERQRTRS